MRLSLLALTFTSLLFANPVPRKVIVPIKPDEIPGLYVIQWGSTPYYAYFHKNGDYDSVLKENVKFIAADTVYTGDWKLTVEDGEQLLVIREECLHRHEESGWMPIKTKPNYVNKISIRRARPWEKGKFYGKCGIVDFSFTQLN